jgi:hypothetical protein
VRFGWRVARRDWSSSLHLAIATIALATAIVLSSTSFAQGRMSDRVLVSTGKEDLAFFVFDHISQTHLRLLVQLLAMSARVPIGFEEIAGEPEVFDGDLSRIPPERRTPLVGRTVGNALDLLTTADRRYVWREQAGLLLLRPVAAWTQTDHFLHRRLPPFNALRRPPEDIAKQLYTLLGARPMSGSHGSIAAPRLPIAGAERAVSITVNYGAALDILNATVLAHSELGWRVYYARGPAEPQNSCVRFITFDGAFSEIGSAACGVY